MAGERDPIREHFIHEVGELANSLGLNRSVGQLYAVLYMSPGPLSLDEMASACRMSKGNASLNVRALERWGAVERAHVSGDRKDYYRPNRDVLGVVKDRLRDGLGRRLSALEAAVERAERELGALREPEVPAQFYGERLAELRQLLRSLRRVLQNMDRLYELARRLM